MGELYILWIFQSTEVFFSAECHSLLCGVSTLAWWQSYLTWRSYSARGRWYSSFTRLLPFIALDYNWSQIPASFMGKITKTDPGVDRLFIKIFTRLLIISLWTITPVIFLWVDAKKVILGKKKYISPYLLMCVNILKILCPMH